MAVKSFFEYYFKEELDCMKRNYVAPIAEIILCEEDVITASLVEVGFDDKSGDNMVFWPGTPKGAFE